MDSTFYSNFGGAAIRYGEVSDVLGVLEAPDNHVSIGMAFQAGRMAEGLALFRLVIGGEKITERGVCRARQLVRVEG